MARVELKWDHVTFSAADVTGWVSFKRVIQLENHATLLSNRTVYVIRIMRPYSFAYGSRHSPVAYIGKGRAQQRLTSHITSWIYQLSRKIPNLKIEIFFCEPRIRKLGTICEHVEADLINEFVKRYKELPLRNRNTPMLHCQYRHQYESKELHILRPGNGLGYHWAIRPLPSSTFFKVGTKRQQKTASPR